MTHPFKHVLLAFTVFCCCLCSLSTLHAQRGRPSSQTPLKPVSKTYALTNVTVVQAPGKVITGATVLIKDGLIAAVGTGIDIPGEAIRLPADSMYVYAGFIDGLSHTGVPRPKEEEERPRVEDPGNPPNELAGIQPERKLFDLLDPQDKAIADMRAAGFTAAHAVPRGRMLPGQGAIILLSGESPEEMVLREGTSLFSQLEGARGLYPTTVIGVMAKWRQLYRQAKLAQKHERAFAAQPTGTKRPVQDPVLQAFYPVINQQMPVFFRAENLLDAHRVLTLQNDLGFPLVIAGLKQGWDLTDKLKGSNIPVFLSLDLPDNKDKDQKGEKADEKGPARGEKPTDAEMKALKERRMKAYHQYHSQAAAFEKAGIDFGFATYNAKAKDLRTNLRSMIEHGLSEEVALAALTTRPAHMLGLSAVMGTVEPGKMANLVVTDNPYFAEEANIRFVFVDGNKYEFEVKKKKKGDPSAQVNAAGKWSYVTQTPQGSSEGTIVIEGEPGNLSGTITNSMMEEARQLDEVELEGNELRFTFSVDGGGQTMLIEVSGIIEGDTFEGTMSVGDFGTFELTAERSPTPNE